MTFLKKAAALIVSVCIMAVGIPAAARCDTAVSKICYEQSGCYAHTICDMARIICAALLKAEPSYGIGSEGRVYKESQTLNCPHGYSELQSCPYGCYSCYEDYEESGPVRDHCYYECGHGYCETEGCAYGCFNECAHGYCEYEGCAYGCFNECQHGYCKSEGCSYGCFNECAHGYCQWEGCAYGCFNNNGSGGYGGHHGGHHGHHGC